MDRSFASQSYEPGDHIGVFAQNESRLVEGIIKHVQDPENADKTYQVERICKGTG